MLLPRAPSGEVFTSLLRSVLAAAGLEMRRTLETPGAAWDTRLRPVASGHTVAALVQDWPVEDPPPGASLMPFDPALTLAMDLVWAPGPSAPLRLLPAAARESRESQGWLTGRRRSGGAAAAD